MGDPIPVIPWAIPLLGLGYGEILIPMGTNLGKIILPPLRKAGLGMGKHNSNPITHG